MRKAGRGFFIGRNAGVPARLNANRALVSSRVDDQGDLQMGNRSGQLVCQHLEGIRRDVLKRFSRIIREYARHRHGVYALYRKGRLYYVGLAQDLRGRLENHLRDRHHGRWDTFSMYLTLRNEHLKDLEALLLRISRPQGNKQSGKFMRSQSLNRSLKGRIRDEQEDELRNLLGLPNRDLSPHSSRNSKATLSPFIKSAFPIRWRFKGVTYKARVRTDGTIRFRSKTFTSPSSAATSITRRAMNGWTCWEYDRGSGDWVPLDKLRNQ